VVIPIKELLSEPDLLLDQWLNLDGASPQSQILLRAQLKVKHTRMHIPSSLRLHLIDQNTLKTAILWNISFYLNIEIPRGENQVFNGVYMSMWFFREKPCANSSVNSIAEYFLLKTVVYKRQPQKHTPNS